MQYWHNGYISLRGQQTIPDEAKRIFEEELGIRIDLKEPGGYDYDTVFCQDAEDVGSGLHLDACVSFEEYLAGDLQSEFSGIVRRLNELGYSVEGEVTYTGDYDGGYLFVGDEVRDVDSDTWTIMHAYTQDLIKELRRRGYSVCGPKDHKTCMEEDDLK